MLNGLRWELSSVIAFVGLASACVGGCGTSHDQSGAVGSSTTALTSDNVGAPIMAFYIEPPSRSPDDIARRAQQIANVVFDTVLPDVSFQPVTSAFAARTASEALHIDVPAHDGLRVGYNPAGDQAWAWNENLMNDYYSTSDVGASAAATVFKKAFSNLVGGGTVDSRGLDPAQAAVSHIVQGSGRTDQPASHMERVKEYVFFIPRLINGIGLANGAAAFPAGVQIAVHRNGGLASAKLSGPIVHSVVGAGGAEVPQPPGYSLVRNVARSDLDARASREYPGATINPLGLQYRLPDDTVASVVVPMQAYSISTNSIVDGHAVHGRVQYVYYSIVDATAPAVLWPIPNPSSKGAPRP